MNSEKQPRFGVGGGQSTLRGLRAISTRPTSPEICAMSAGCTPADHFPSRMQPGPTLAFSYMLVFAS